ncbi:TPA: hypothetical protein ACXNPT_003533 [Clostridium botulinum]|uniref:hypothetical protein n=1 Tax=Clostridium botulinum TaxID=1491 RepID=UPI0012E2C76A|nr:hypothetical protein [Clostridium botulinum]QGT45383.1 hypothetical protein GJ703_03664 [Clostridium botulinum]
MNFDTIDKKKENVILENQAFQKLQEINLMQKMGLENSLLKESLAQSHEKLQELK